MVSAAAQDQWRLLDVQSHDTRLSQIAHRERHLPELAELTELEARSKTLHDEVVAARTALGDVNRELAKAEADVEQVRSRADRDSKRLESGQGTPKDLQALQNELESLAQRQSVLEDAELEVMERAEAAQNAVDAAETTENETAEKIAEVTARRDAALAQLEAEAGTERTARDNAAAGVPDDLLKLYERIRENSGGVGAAKLYQRRCEGCRLELNNTDINRLRAAAETDVVRCEECGRILVRTADSGL